MHEEIQNQIQNFLVPFSIGKIQQCLQPHTLIGSGSGGSGSGGSVSAIGNGRSGGSGQSGSNRTSAQEQSKYGQGSGTTNGQDFMMHKYTPNSNQLPSESGQDLISRNSNARFMTAPNTNHIMNSNSERSIMKEKQFSHQGLFNLLKHSS